MPTEIDLPLVRDKTFTWDGVAQKYNATTGAWETLDLTGTTIRLIARKAVGDDDPTPVIDLSSASPTAAGSITPLNQGTDEGGYVLRIEAAATADADDFPDDRPEYFPFEIELTEVSGERTVLASGFFKYRPDVR